MTRPGETVGLGVWSGLALLVAGTAFADGAVLTPAYRASAPVSDEQLSFPWGRATAVVTSVVWGSAQILFTVGKVWSAFVEQDIDQSLVPADDRAALLDRHGRRAARKAARAAGGRVAGRLSKHLQYAQLRYVQSVMEEGADSDRVQALAVDIRELQSLAV